jgi:glucose-6-phosphate isomerase, archaeal
MTLAKASLENQPTLEWFAGKLSGTPVRRSTTNVGDLARFFLDKTSLERMDPATVVYRVEWWEPVSLGVEGGLLWGSTMIEPGRVGDEYFMTKGHFHAIRNRGEYYCTVQGSGMLLLMDEQRRTRVEIMSPGSLHYIPGGFAHRSVNTGDSVLCFWACWPSDAGHDYETVATRGFSTRVLSQNGKPVLVNERIQDGDVNRD